MYRRSIIASNDICLLISESANNLADGDNQDLNDLLRELETAAETTVNEASPSFASELENDTEDIACIQEGDKGVSMTKKLGTVNTHFRYFARRFLNKNYSGVENLKKEEVTSKLVGKFANYLVRFATKNLKPNGEPLMWNTLSQYFSVFKVYFHDRFQPPPVAVTDESTKRVVQHMRRVKIKLVRAAGTSWVNEKEKASIEDIIAFAMVCYWEGDLTSAELLHLQRACFFNGGRGSEVAYLDWDHAYMTDITVRQCNVTFKTLGTNVLRLKTARLSNRCDELQHFVHRESFLKDYCFAMFHHLVLQNPTIDEDNAKHMFPHWKGLVTDKEKQVDSKVSAVFTKLWSQIHQLAQKYGDHMPSDPDSIPLANMNESMTLHAAGKKACAQFLGDTNIAPQHLLHHLGWALKTFHTYFDYWCGGRVSTVMTGLQIAGWDSNVNDIPQGVPPSLDEVPPTVVNHAKVDKFVEALLGSHGSISYHVRRHIVAVGMGFYQDYVEFMQKEPSSKYATYESLVSKAPFAHYVESAREQVGMSQEEMLNLCKSLKHQFLWKNAFAIPEFLAKMGTVDYPIEKFHQYIPFNKWISMSDKRSHFLMAQVHKLQDAVLAIGEVSATNSDLLASTAEKVQNLENKLASLSFDMKKTFTLVEAMATNTLGVDKVTELLGALTLEESSESANVIGRPNAGSRNPVATILGGAVAIEPRMVITDTQMSYEAINDHVDKIGGDLEQMFLYLLEHRFEQAYNSCPVDKKKKLKAPMARRRFALKIFRKFAAKELDISEKDTILNEKGIHLSDEEAKAWKRDTSAALKKAYNAVVKHLVEKNKMKESAKLSVSSIYNAKGAFKEEKAEEEEED
ncbi:hypothetical protein CTEN210_04611 [Chaetoceros tenuissimus]|uniref:Uncharacterized protein n=1 Tax=Chaetoceros tenuissimus TaxID=426638 RepID=A0AAD3CNY1_9STRA|nr:hypothetical protein CTEN210_04611 [Chaetoceros tenuissimus]